MWRRPAQPNVIDCPMSIEKDAISFPSGDGHVAKLSEPTTKLLSVLPDSENTSDRYLMKTGLSSCKGQIISGNENERNSWILNLILVVAFQARS